MYVNDVGELFDFFVLKNKSLENVYLKLELGIQWKGVMGESEAEEGGDGPLKKIGRTTRPTNRKGLIRNMNYTILSNIRWEGVRYKCFIRTDINFEKGLHESLFGR